MRKSKIFHEPETEWICENVCHLAIEEIIRQRENELLRQHPELYDQVWREFVRGDHDPFEIVRRMRKRQSKNGKKKWRRK